MTYQIVLSTKAYQDLQDASLWYGSQNEVLGLQFLEVIERKLKIIEQFPERYPIRNSNFRETPVRTFPYLIIYKLYKQKKQIVVFRVFHTRRNPRTKFKK